jgi:hypothetical protein
VEAVKPREGGIEECGEEYWEAGRIRRFVRSTGFLLSVASISSNFAIERVLLDLIVGVLGLLFPFITNPV